MSDLLIARLRAAPDAVETEGRYLLGRKPAAAWADPEVRPAQYLLALVQAGVAAGARQITIESTRHSTVFMHDGRPPSEEDLAALLLDGPGAASGRALEALGMGLSAADSGGASVALSVRRERRMYSVESDRAGVHVDPAVGGWFAAHWSVRVVVRGMPFGEDVRDLAERVAHAPIKIVLNEVALNSRGFGRDAVSPMDVMRGRCVACRLPPPWFHGGYPRGRLVVEIRWLPPDPDPDSTHGLIGLSLPLESVVELERIWDEESWPLLDDPAMTRPDFERNRFRRTLTFLQEDGEARRVGLYRAVTTLRARADAGGVLLAVKDGVALEPEPLDRLRGVLVVAAADAQPTRGFRRLPDAGFEAPLAERAELLDRVLESEFPDATREGRVAHALSGRRGARILHF